MACGEEFMACGEVIMRRRASFYGPNWLTLSG